MSLRSLFVFLFLPVVLLGQVSIPWADVEKTGSSLADLATRSASDLNSGTLPDARFPATLPAASGVNLTALNATQLTSGTVPLARLYTTLSGYGITDAQPLDSDLTSWAAVVRASGFDTFTATPSSANFASLVTDETGTGVLYFQGGALGTPSSATLTNATGLPVSTGVDGLGTGVATFLGTPSSANLASAITDETGTGYVVLSASPTFSGTPLAPTAGAGTNTTQIATTAFVRTAVDAATQALDLKASVRAIATANITLSGEQTIDGVAIVAGDRVLVAGQGTGSQNGIYVVAAGAWTRATDADTSADVTSGMFTFVSEGTANGSNGYVLTTPEPIVLGTTALTFSQFSGAGQIIAGTGLAKSGNTLSTSGIPNASLTNSTITIAGTSTALGASISLDTITGLSTAGLVKRTGSNALAIATAGTDYLTPSGNGSALTGLTQSQISGLTTASTPTFAGLSLGSGSLTAGAISGTTGTFSSTVQLGTGGSSKIAAIGDATIGGDSQLRLRPNPAELGWSIGASTLAANALTLTPSTAAGGSTFSTPVATFTSTGLNNTVIGATTPAAGSFTTLAASGAVTLNNTAPYQAKDTGGTARSLLFLFSDDNVYIDNQVAGGHTYVRVGGTQHDFTAGGLAVTGEITTKKDNGGLILNNSSSGNAEIYWQAGGVNKYRIGVVGGSSPAGIRLYSDVDGAMFAYWSNSVVQMPTVYSNTTASAANVFVESDGTLKRSTSSLRYKRDPQPYTRGLADVLKLRPVTYKGINDGDKVFAGLIAEEVAEAGLEEFVIRDSENRPDALHYPQMVALAFAAIKEQDAEIKSLRARVAALEAK
jgi:hypothetical protein